MRALCGVEAMRLRRNMADVCRLEIAVFACCKCRLVFVRIDCGTKMA